MKKRLLILGGGHTGSSAALAAAKQAHDLGKSNDIEITLVDQFNCLTVRPRLYEYELESTQVPLKDFLNPVGVTVIQDSIESINFDKQTAHLKQQTLSFDALVLAMGSELAELPIPGLSEHTYNIDAYQSAIAFRSAFEEAAQQQETLSVAILGGGLTGIELACELSTTLNKITLKHQCKQPTLKITLLDRNTITENLGSDPKPYLEKTFQQLNIHCLNQVTINAIDKSGVCYNESEFLDADITVSTLGLRANKLTKSLNIEKNPQGRIQVDQQLRIPGHQQCFAAGDIAVCKADNVHESIMSCQQGRPQGRYAGYNAVNQLFGQALTPYSQPNYVTCVDLGSAGAIFTKGWERKVELFGEKAKELKQHINQDRIYPPQPYSKEVLLEAGVIDFISPVKTKG